MPFLSYHTTVFSDFILDCGQKTSLPKTNAFIPTNDSDDSQYCHRMKPFGILNKEQQKKPYFVLRTTMNPSFCRKTKQALKYSFLDYNVSTGDEVNKSVNNSPKQFKGPLDDLMTKIVGDRWISSFEENEGFGNHNNTCDEYLLDNEFEHHSNCILELEDLKQSLSSYSISSLK